VIDRRSRTFVLTLAGVLYFSEGFPYGLVNELAPIYLRMQHVSLEEIGLLSTIGAAWTFKVFWSPLIEFGTYRRWISGALATMTLLLATLAVVPPVAGPAFWTILTLLVVASATQDIAVDAFTIRATPEELLGPVNSMRVMAYRAALLAGGGGLAAVAGGFGWRAAFGVATAIAAVIFLFTLAVPDDRAREDGARKHEGLRPLIRWLARPRAALLLAMVLLYRLGEFAVVPMTKPYWVDRGYAAGEIGTITTVIGVPVSIAGAVLGGLFIARYGLYRGMLWLGVAQVASNVGYGLVATIHAGRTGIYAASVIENLGYGLGTAAFLAFLMAVCDRENAATEYALLTAAFGITRTLMGTASGWLAQHMGYGPYFWLTVALGVPALLLLPFIRADVQRDAQREPQAA
jgi:PAT family beta-lactamase induction signal transducer AmpG